MQTSVRNKKANDTVEKEENYSRNCVCSILFKIFHIRAEI